MPKSSPLLDTRVIYCGDNLEQLKKLPAHSIDLIYIDPPFNSNRNYEVFWGETREKRSFDDRHESTQAYIEFMRPRCVELARVLKQTGSFYYHCDWHASHYVKVMLDQILAAEAESAGRSGLPTCEGLLAATRPSKRVRATLSSPTSPVRSPITCGSYERRRLLADCLGYFEQFVIRALVANEAPEFATDK